MNLDKKFMLSNKNASSGLDKTLSNVHSFPIGIYLF